MLSLSLNQIFLLLTIICVVILYIIKKKKNKTISNTDILKRYIFNIY